MPHHKDLGKDEMDEMNFLCGCRGREKRGERGHTERRAERRGFSSGTTKATIVAATTSAESHPAAYQQKVVGKSRFARMNERTLTLLKLDQPSQQRALSGWDAGEPRVILKGKYLTKLHEQDNFAILSVNGAFENVFNMKYDDAIGKDIRCTACNPMCAPLLRSALTMNAPERLQFLLRTLHQLRAPAAIVPQSHRCHASQGLARHPLHLSCV